LVSSIPTSVEPRQAMGSRHAVASGADPNGRGVHMAEQIGDGEVVARGGAGQSAIGDASQHIDHASVGRR
jgi:hypothetical protein